MYCVIKSAKEEISLPIYGSQYPWIDYSVLFDSSYLKVQKGRSPLQTLTNVAGVFQTAQIDLDILTTK